MERAHGFQNQRPVVVPRPLVREALTRPITRHLVVTDAGVFPAAEDHGRYRPQGADETIVILCVAGRGWVETAGARTDVVKATAVVLRGGTARDMRTVPTRTTHGRFGGATSAEPMPRS